MKDAVNKLLGDWHDSLRLPGTKYWKIVGISDPSIFFSQLPKVFPHGQTLLIEGIDMGLSAKMLYQEHPALFTRKVACDTLSPTPDSYHVEFSAKFSERLCRLISSQGLESSFYHFKG